jgi:hypothetical protein
MAICSICGAANPTHETHCAICGARLPAQRDAALTDDSQALPERFYSSAMGEDDLMAARGAGGLLLGIVLFLLGMAAAAGLFFGVSILGGDDPTPTPTIPFSVTAPGFATLTPAMFATATFGPSLTPSQTRIPPPPLPTVTEFILPSPTSNACTLTVSEGDTLYGLALQCGHRDLAVVEAIVELNSLRCDTCLQIGQVIEIPFPTPTDAPAESGALPAEDVNTGAEVAANDTMADELSAEDRIATRQVQIEPTLDPNLMYHIILRDQTLYDVVAIYDVDVKLLSEINPEIDFPQCDFGERFGGPTCAVFFLEGQQIRVPAPTPTPTVQPTSSGSETPTPTATATINVPAAFAPTDGAEFDAASIVTLRWTTTGTLAQDEVYAVHVENMESDEQFTAITCDQALDIPRNWQAEQERFLEYEWWVSVVRVSGGAEDSYTVRASGLELCGFSFVPSIEWITSINDLGQIHQIALGEALFQTEPRSFLWQGLVP